MVTKLRPAVASGSGKPVEIVDQYWYSPDLSVYLIMQHDDPRTGEQIVAVKEISRTAPDESLFLYRPAIVWWTKLRNPNLLNPEPRLHRLGWCIMTRYAFRAGSPHCEPSQLHYDGPYLQRSAA